MFWTVTLTHGLNLIDCKAHTGTHVDGTARRLRTRFPLLQPNTHDTYAHQYIHKLTDYAQL